eukprot:g3389.t1
MSRDQRSEDNWALLKAQEIASERKAPIHVCFNLVPKFLEASLRQYHFMITGLQETEMNLRKKGIPFHLVLGNPMETIPRLAKTLNCCAVVCDMSPLRVPMAWSKGVAQIMDKDLKHVPLFQVDAHNIVPVWACSPKQEYAARTIRRKVHEGMKTYFTDFPSLRKQEPLRGHDAHAANVMPDLVDWEKAWETLEIDRSIEPVSWLKPGSRAAHNMLTNFCSDGRLKFFDEKRNDPNVEHCASNLSPFTHFGQLSCQRAALVVQNYARSHSVCSAGAKAFIEESVVRRELSDNFCFYNHQYYDSVKGASGWAQETLSVHSSDKREYVYSRSELEGAKTHDPLWNAAQTQMVETGKMHGFLRMYWAKKILEWTPSPEQALADAIYLNDRFSLDGRDPNGYVGCMWSICGIHDMGWKERDIFGKIRFMNYNGCKRKFDVAAFERKWNGESMTGKNALTSWIKREGSKTKRKREPDSKPKKKSRRPTKRK